MRPPTLSISNAVQTRFLMVWHATFSGGFIIAYVSQDVPAMHLFAGYLVLAAVAARLIAGIFARPKSPLALPNPLAATRLWLEKIKTGGKARNPLLAVLAAALLISIGLAAVSGALADLIPATKDLHEGLAEFTPAVVAAHVGFVAFKPLKKYLLGQLAIQKTA